VNAPTTAAVRPTPARNDLRRIQRRSMSTLVITQIIGGAGVAIGVTVGTLLSNSLGGTRIAGLGQSSLVIGAALLALPVTRLMRSRGRRPGLALAYLLGATGAVVVVAGAAGHSIPLVFAGLFLFGGGSAANYQARYAAVDLAEPARRGRQLSFVVWATTIGAVAGPNLAPPADAVIHRFGAVTYSGPFAFSAVAFGLAALLVWVLLRPDPLLVAVSLGRSSGAGSVGPGSVGPPAGESQARIGLRAAFREVAALPAARLGIASVAVGHLVMIAVMVMTPIHIGEAITGGPGGHGGDTLRITGVVLSAHIAGMYALSPLTGWLTDRLGRRPVILTGVALLLAACATAGTAGHDTGRLIAGLTLLGVGWSATMVAGSTLLTESVGLVNRPVVQGLSDFVMGVAGASAGALSGVVVAWSSYETLTALAALATVPLLALALRTGQARLAGTSGVRLREEA
jgi:MFS family permease